MVVVSSIVCLFQKKKEKEKSKSHLAERGFDPRTSGLWAQHASTAPLCSVMEGERLSRGYDATRVLHHPTVVFA